ncbi:class I SAM-dependent methyltransferase [Pontivivens ytuae]|uniref:Class I SAM-dependent methyltransferase n=1 Tax=Pontivivens ytuae TaxID=2789856 RepID=A0A7S9LQP2_9RHOB|nr:class I SAM-dependent methyltransferase [Pontivivens ytuae]QPH53536.1 class I SAM-dependent methyltransferase [Pontivivens ytuae]
MATIEDWKGRVGREWADKADAMEGLLGPIGAEGMAALGSVSGHSVLDLGCGAGDTALALAARGAEVTGVDVSEDLLAVARTQPGAERVTWRLADASSATFEQPFDALHSRCGAMFFDDPAAGWAHLRTQVTPGGQLAVSCWRAASLNGWVTIPLAAARPVLGEEATQAPPAGGAGPFGWADEAYVRDLLTGAGWSDVALTPVDREAAISTGSDPDPVARATAFTLRIGILASRLRERSEEERAAVADALAAAFAPLVREGAVRIPTAGWIVTARA